MLANSFARPGVAIRTFRPQILHDHAFMTSALAPMNRLAAAFLEEARGDFNGQSG